MNSTNQTTEDKTTITVGSKFPMTPSDELKNPVSNFGSVNVQDSRCDVREADKIPGNNRPEKLSELCQVEKTSDEENKVPKITNMQTLMHIFKSNIGTGILALPMAVKHAGLWTGLAGILFVGAVAVHCMHMLLNCSQRLCRRTGSTMLDYAGVMEMCLKTGPPAGHKFFKYVRPFVDSLLIFTQLGACCVYIIFVAANIQMVVGYYGLDVRGYEFGVMCLLLPFVCIRNLKLLAPFSAFANVLTITGLIIIIQYIVQELPAESSRPVFTSIEEIPLFFGTALFTVEGIGLVLPLRNSMERPQDFGGWAGVLNLGMTGTVSLYATIGFYGYLQFGDQIQGSITLNMPSNTLYLCVRVMFAISILITYNIQFYVPITLLWPRIVARFKRDPNRKLEENLFRIGIVIMTFGFAAAVPHIDLLISLIGAVACSFLALILPALIEWLTLMGEEEPLPKHIFVKDVLIFMFGVFGTIIGTYTSLKDIINQM